MESRYSDYDNNNNPNGINTPSHLLPASDHMNCFMMNECYRSNHPPYLALLNQWQNEVFKQSRLENQRDNIYLERISNLQRISNDQCNEIDRLKMMLMEKDTELMDLRRKCQNLISTSSARNNITCSSSSSSSSSSGSSSSMFVNVNNPSAAPSEFLHPGVAGILPPSFPRPGNNPYRNGNGNGSSHPLQLKPCASSTPREFNYKDLEMDNISAICGSELESHAVGSNPRFFLGNQVSIANHTNHGHGHGQGQGPPPKSQLPETNIVKNDSYHFVPTPMPSTMTMTSSPICHSPISNFTSTATTAHKSPLQITIKRISNAGTTSNRPGSATGTGSDSGNSSSQLFNSGNSSRNASSFDDMRDPKQVGGRQNQEPERDVPIFSVVSNECPMESSTTPSNSVSQGSVTDPGTGVQMQQEDGDPEDVTDFEALLNQTTASFLSAFPRKTLTWLVYNKKNAKVKSRENRKESETHSSAPTEPESESNQGPPPGPEVRYPVRRSDDSSFKIVRIRIEATRKKSTYYKNFVARIKKETVTPAGRKLFQIEYYRRKVERINGQLTDVFITAPLRQKYICEGGDVVHDLPKPMKERRGKILFDFNFGPYDIPENE